MRNLKSLALIALTALAVSACSSNKNEVELASEAELFSIGQQSLQSGDYNKAIRYLEAVDTRFPAGTYSEQAQLNLIYVAYKNDDYTKVAVTADRFLQQHSHSQYADYVFYMAALANMTTGDNAIQDLFGIDRSTRENTTMRTAYSNFEKMVQYFPKSQYTPDALARMAYIKDRLARHELEIARFYAKRDAWVAVANRVTGMLRVYPDTYSTIEALPLLQQAYKELGLTKLEQQATALVEANKGKRVKEAEKPSEPFLSLPSWLKFNSDESEAKTE